MIKAEIIADSINKTGQRLTTFVLIFPRIVLAEFNTHRMLSRNSASSRAIPFVKMLKMVQENPFIPIKWMKEHKGMQGSDYLNDASQESYLVNEWLSARNAAVAHAERLSNFGLTKQIVNRLLEPFMWHTVIVTGTEWQNFFALRAHPAAEIHIADLAAKMLDAYNQSIPKSLKKGEWHIPFGDRINLPSPIPIPEGLSLDEGVAMRKVMIATARCARVSYLNFEGKDDYDADIKLHNMLKESGHMSPFEHCAQAMGRKQMKGESFNYDDGDEGTWGWSGNFRGFVQYRKMLGGENKQDPRVIQKLWKNNKK